MKDMSAQCTIKSINTSRNGIAGRSFTAVRFLYNEDGYVHDLIAVVPSGVLDGPDGIEVYVISADDPTQHWRGDNFAATVKRFIDEHKLKEERAP